MAPPLQRLPHAEGSTLGATRVPGCRVQALLRRGVCVRACVRWRRCLQALLRGESVCTRVTCVCGLFNVFRVDRLNRTSHVDSISLQIMRIEPMHVAWRRTRPRHHGGAPRVYRYFQEDEEIEVRGPGQSRQVCVCVCVCVCVFVCKRGHAHQNMTTLAT